MLNKAEVVAKGIKEYINKGKILFQRIFSLS